jgi:hypothetical protein
MKKDSLFNAGMKPAVLSKYSRDHHKKGWSREGSNISYKKNDIQREGSDKGNYYTLSFQYTFEYTNDTVYFA